MKDIKDPAFRLDYYEKMLAATNLHYILGLCMCIVVVRNLYFKNEHYSIGDFSELKHQKPSHTYNGAYWWKPGNKELRIRALNRAIAEVKLLINPTK